MAEERNLYNLVLLHNYTSEDFIFRVNNEPYIIRAGEKRKFLKFQANLATKHFIDKVLITASPEGRTMADPVKRAEVAAKFVLGEEKFEKPVIPTDAEILREVNQESDLQKALKGKDATPAESVVETPQPDFEGVANSAAGVPPANATIDTSGASGEAGVPPADQPVDSTPTTISPDEKPTEMPKRTEMMKYARDVLKLDIKNEKVKARLDKLTDKQLFEELQIGQ